MSAVTRVPIAVFVHKTVGKDRILEASKDCKHDDSVMRGVQVVDRRELRS